MGRRIEITKEQILEAGLQLVIREGYGAISITRLAAELGTSMSPITYTFHNIENYRKELRLYATAYMQQKMMGTGENITTDHKNIGHTYVDMAIDEPNLIRYLRSDESDLRKTGGIGFIFDQEKNTKISKAWAAEFEISEQDAIAFMQFAVAFTEGVVSIILSGVIKPRKEEVHQLIEDASSAYMMYLKSGRKKH